MRKADLGVVTAIAYALTFIVAAASGATGDLLTMLLLWPAPVWAALGSGWLLERWLFPLFLEEHRLERRLERARREQRIIDLRRRLEVEEARTRKELEQYLQSEAP